MTGGAEPAAAGEGTLASAGEFGLIAALTGRLSQGPGVLLGPGDDAAVVATPDGRVVASTDLLVAGRHFRLDYSSAHDVGRKAAAANLADIAAMGARPTALLLGLAAPPELATAWALELADGLNAECTAVGASVVGGDVVRAETLMIAITALGDLAGRTPLTRSGARPGDVVALCGRLGAAQAGLELLRAGSTAHPDLTAAQRAPTPPYAAGPQAAELGATALVDVSDGLLADLGHVARASGVGIDLFAGALEPPPDLCAAAADLGADARVWVLTGGEDHALAGCFPPGVAPPLPWVVIGSVHAGSGITVDGAPWTGPAGWDHYR